MPHDLERDRVDMTRMMEMMTIAEPVLAYVQVFYTERHHAALLMPPAAAGVTALPPCRPEVSLWLM